MRITVLFFGMLKDFVGRSRETLEIEEGARLETLFERYASEFPRLREMENSIAFARNEEFADRAAVLSDGDEVAFMPPVSGGGGDAAEALPAIEEENGYYCLTREPIDAAALSRRIASGEDGATLTFEGVVRNNSAGRATRFLDYECYPPLAIKTLRDICRDALERGAIRAVAVVHRLGRLEIGETSIAIVVASAHRRPAYEASLEIIDRIKKRAPVWKKEYFEDGEAWVEGEWEDSVETAAGAAK